MEKNEELGTELGRLAHSSLPATVSGFKAGSPTFQESPQSHSNGTFGYSRSKSHQLDPVRSQEGALALYSDPSSNPS